jgi:site-specific DNA-cytosine methylase
MNSISQKGNICMNPFTIFAYITFRFMGTTAEQYRQIGNGIAVPVGEWAGHELVRYFEAA